MKGLFLRSLGFIFYFVEWQWNSISVEVLHTVLYVWGQKDEWNMICALQELIVQYKS